MTESTDRPLVTLALFAYNQERYIREAVEGALSQDYTPLQIILSDDCSSDRTFEIMRDLAEGYQGPHTIVLNRNEQNLGIGGHIRRMANVADGEIVVAAAGDDISLSARVSTIVNAFVADPTVFAVMSASYDIDETGNHLRISDDNLFATSTVGLARRGGGTGSGATYAYRREVFFWPAEYPQDCLSEDRILPFRASILGRIHHIRKPLILRRVGIPSVSRSPSFQPAQVRPEHNRHLQLTVHAALQEGRITGSTASRLTRIIYRSARMRSAAIRSRQRLGVIGRILYRVLINMISWDMLHRRVYARASGWLTYLTGGSRP